MAQHDQPDDDSDESRNGRMALSKIPEVVGKVIVGFVATAYAMGFLITNIALAGYGAGTVELIRAEYILTGSSFMLLCGTASLYCVQLWRAMTSRDEALVPTKGLQAGMVTIAYCAVIWFLTQLLASFREMNFQETAACVVPILTSPVFVGLPYVFYQKALKRWSYETPTAQIQVAGWTVTAYCMSLLMLVGIYSHTTFPLLDRTYGGGRPIRVKLVLDDTDDSSLRETLAVVLDRRSGSCELVAETPDWILIRKGSGNTPKDARPVRISRSLVRAIVPAADL